MVAKKKIFAISGSTRLNSSNYNLLKAIQDLTVGNFEMVIFENIASLPHFNPDIDGESSKTVKDFKQQISQANGVIICTPEYAHGVPGTLKNAIDWCVGSGEFYQKPTVLITASTDGQFGHQALLETLRVIEAKAIEELNLRIPYIRTKVDSNSKIIDQATEITINELILNFIKFI